LLAAFKDLVERVSSDEPADSVGLQSKKDRNSWSVINGSQSLTYAVDANEWLGFEDGKTTTQFAQCSPYEQGKAFKIAMTSLSLTVLVWRVADLVAKNCSNSLYCSCIIYSVIGFLGFCAWLAMLMAFQLAQFNDSCTNETVLSKVSIAFTVTEIVLLLLGCCQRSDEDNPDGDGTEDVQPRMARIQPRSATDGTHSAAEQGTAAQCDAAIKGNPCYRYGQYYGLVQKVYAAIVDVVDTVADVLRLNENNCVGLRADAKSWILATLIVNAVTSSALCGLRVAPLLPLKHKSQLTTKLCLRFDQMSDVLVPPLVLDITMLLCPI
jgi:hypothetical protein